MKNMRLTLTLILLAAPVWARKPRSRPVKHPAESQPAPSVDRDVAGVIDLFYDLRLDEALAAAQSLEHRYPGHPAGPFYCAIVSYQRYLQSVSTSPAALDGFDRDSARALDAAQALAKTQPAVSEFYLGAMMGFQARAQISAKHFTLAVSTARQAVKHLQKASELDPSLEGVQLGLGMYDYFMSQLAKPLKAMAYAATGLWGDRERGLAALIRVSESSGPGRMEARAVLSAIYASDKERQWMKAEALLRELTARYPGNPLYRLRLAYVLESQQRWDDAAAAADPDGPWIQKLNPDLRELARQAGSLRKAEVLLFARKPEAAKTQLDRLDASPLPPRLKSGLLSLKQDFPNPPLSPSKVRWPLAGLPSDRR